MKSIGVTIDETLLERLDEQPEVREQGRSAVLRRAVADYLAARAPENGDACDSPVGTSAPREALTLDFLSRLLKFVEWEPGWDGEAAEHIDHSTAQRALEIALDMRAVAPEPFVAPAPSGSLLLQWDFPDGTSVEVFVDGETEFPAEAALTCDGLVHEVALAGPAKLRAVLTEHAAPPSASR